LLALSQLWSEAKYNFVFFDHAAQVDWDASYRDYLGRVSEATTAVAYYRTLAQFMAQLNDGHTTVYQPAWWARPPLATDWVEERLYVRRSGSEVRGTIPPGSIITHINGLPTAQYVQERVLPIVAASTDHHRLAIAARQARAGPPSTEVEVQFQTPNGLRGRARLARSRRDQSPPIDWSPSPPSGETLQFRWSDEPLGGSTGNSIQLQLPGGLEASICAERHAWPNGDEYVGVGVRPHIEVAPTIRDLRSGRDAELETARSFLRRTLRRER
jgi:hypothetical protein